jgi:hypothetical protein
VPHDMNRGAYPHGCSATCGEKALSKCFGICFSPQPCGIMVVDLEGLNPLFPADFSPQTFPRSIPPVLGFDDPRPQGPPPHEPP